MKLYPSFPPAAEDKNTCITKQPVNITKLFSESHHPEAGAVVLFSGEVRDSNLQKQVIYIDYEAEEQMAAHMIAQITEEAKKRWKLTAAIAQHRIGKVQVGESAVVVITASAHRKEAYEANRYIIDKIKHEVPIWKCEYFCDGTKEWGGNCNCHQITGDLNKHVYEYK